jgi:hypothetical protein
MKNNRSLRGPVFRGARIKAKYTASKDPMYRHNAFIEALPLVLEDEQVMDRITRLPAYDKAERLLDDIDRLEAVQRISNFVDPMPIHFELYRRFSRLIRSGYMARNPIEAEWKKQLRSGFPNIAQGTGDDGYEPIIRSTAGGFGILGISGVGKSTAVESVLGLFPQVIEHAEYNGNPFLHHQLVWLKVECPKDGSTKSLCKDIVKTIDQIMNEDFAGISQINKLNTNDRIPVISDSAFAVGLGVLVIDEIQRLNEAASGGAKEMMNFFVHLINTVGVPVVLVGTPRSLKFIKNDFSYARRLSGQGDMIWSNLPNDDQWEVFVKDLWKYQWTKKKTPYTPDLGKALYEESQGIVDIAVKLYMFAQWNIIGVKSAQAAGEPITAALIRSVAKDNLKLLRPAFDALRSGDPERLKNIQDIHISFEDLDDYLHGAKERLTLEGKLNMIRNRRMTEENGQDDSEEGLHFQVARWLVEADISPDIAMACAKKAIDLHGANMGLKDVMKEALALATETSEKTKNSKTDGAEAGKPPAKEKGKVVSLSGDLRKIVKEGHKKGASAHEALKEAGVVKNASEFLSA